MSVGGVFRLQNELINPPSKSDLNKQTHLPFGLMNLFFFRFIPQSDPLSPLLNTLWKVVGTKAEASLETH